MNTGEFSQSLSSKWATHRATVRRVLDHAGPQISIIHTHFIEIADILCNEIKHEVIFSTEASTCNIGGKQIIERVHLDCAELELNWVSSICYGYNDLTFEGKKYGYGAMEYIKGYINDSVAKKFTPPNITLVSQSL